MAVAFSLSRVRYSLLLQLRPLSTATTAAASTTTPMPASIDASMPTPSVPPPCATPKPVAVPIDPAVKRLARSRRFSEIEALLEEKKKDPKITEEPFLSSVIVSYAYANMLDRAISTFDQMDALGCSPRTTISLNALLSSYSHARNHARVPELFADLSRKHSISPDMFSYSILINALCESGTPEKAFPILKEMEEKGLAVTVVTYTPIVDALYRLSRPEEAEKVWKEMVERGCIPDTAAYNVRAKYLAYHRKPEDLLRFIEEMEKSEVEPNVVTYNFLITCYCKNGKFLDAKSLYKSLKGKNITPNSATYRSFMFFLCKNGDFEFGFKVCKDGIKKNKYPDFGPAKLLVKGLVKDSKETEAKWLIEEMKKKCSPSMKESWNKVEEQLGFRNAAAEDSVEVVASA